MTFLTMWLGGMVQIFKNPNWLRFGLGEFLKYWLLPLKQMDGLWNLNKQYIKYTYHDSSPIYGCHRIAFSWSNHTHDDDDYTKNHFNDPKNQWSNSMSSLNLSRHVYLFALISLLLFLCYSFTCFTITS